ncbi:MAG: hypothetical protein WCX34_08970 [Syntrophales bacterium]
MYFSPEQISLADQAFVRAEALASGYFRLDPGALKAHRYDVRTKAYLKEHEVQGQAFAHLCKYEYGKETGDVGAGDRHFYRICLQDDRILDAVKRAHSFIRLSPLLLYIATHELVHVIRFDEGVIPFDAPREVKDEEEETVHQITRRMLQPAANPELGLVLDCFSDRYRIGDLDH